MSDTVVYEIQPKTVETSGQENNLLQYSIINDAENSVEESLVVPYALGTYVDLPSITSHKLIEFQADQDVYFAIYVSGAKTIEFTACRNLILKCTSGVYTYKVKNEVGVGIDANIVWRLYV
jgi:hypothetical protein